MPRSAILAATSGSTCGECLADPYEITVRVENHHGQSGVQQDLFQSDTQRVRLPGAALPAPECMAVQTLGDQPDRYRGVVDQAADGERGTCVGEEARHCRRVAATCDSRSEGCRGGWSGQNRAGRIGGGLGHLIDGLHVAQMLGSGPVGNRHIVAGPQALLG